MTEFKKGDRIVFVEDDHYDGIDMPKGTLATYNDDDPINAAPYVLLDTGERVPAWRTCIDHAEDHGTGDGSASDICAEPGCNCDLERRFPAPVEPEVTAADVNRASAAAAFERWGGKTDPAPLDPSKVKAGDTVTVRVEPNPDTGWGTLDHGPEAIEVTGKVWLDSGDNPHGPVLKVGVHAIGRDNVTLTDHQPAPEPEPADALAQAAWEAMLADGADGREVFRADKVADAIRAKFVVIDPAAVDVDMLVDTSHNNAMTKREVVEHVLGTLGIEVPR